MYSALCLRTPHKAGRFYETQKNMLNNCIICIFCHTILICHSGIVRTASAVLHCECVTWRIGNVNQKLKYLQTWSRSAKRHLECWQTHHHDCWSNFYFRLQFSFCFNLIGVVFKVQLIFFFWFVHIYLVQNLNHEHDSFKPYNIYLASF